MHLIEKALQIALNAHAGQSDKAGKPYIMHPLRMMLQMQTDDERITALLHDVIEDSQITDKDLTNAGIPSHIIATVKVLTRSEQEDYDAFIERVLTNKLAVKVKIADIEDNLNVLRMDTLHEKDFVRIAKYHKAWQRLKAVFPQSKFKVS
jgi:(p)ppGpp synthase/HD superfamily hydrolase